jgi:hypothetical protein
VVAALLLIVLAVPGLAETKRRRLVISVAALSVAAAGFLVAPAAWSESTLEAPVNGTFPGAGPDFVSGLGGTSTGRFVFGGGSARGGFAPPSGGGQFGGPPTGARAGGFGGGSTDISAALKYAETHGATSRFALIVSSEQEAASYVVKGENVSAMGGFTGRETVLMSSYLSSLVRSGQARYFLLGGSGSFGPGGSSNAATSLIESTCTAVSSGAWSSGSTSSGSTLYDCADKADAIANAG